ncbi:MAG: hypothetical protein K0B05_06290 [Bacteroidales bacterium]|nr:hypothetical protein [Bacteroidales bacterium]
MKKPFLIIFFLLFAFRAVAPDQKALFITSPPPMEPFDRLIQAVIMVESKGDTMAFNINEQAAGLFQIRPIRVLDYNMRTGSLYTPGDMFDYEISKKIFLYYASQIGPYKFERIAKSWNGSGVKTLDYWNRVKKYL